MIKKQCSADGTHLLKLLFFSNIFFALQFLMHCGSNGKNGWHTKKWHAKEKHNSHKRYLSCIRTHAKRGEIVTNLHSVHIVYWADFRLHYSFHAFVSFGLFFFLFHLASAHSVYVIHCERPFFLFAISRFGATFFHMWYSCSATLISFGWAVVLVGANCS